jgi:hypothetical protein
MGPALRFAGPGIASTSRQRLPRLAFVIDQPMPAPFHVMADRCPDFVCRHVLRDHAPRNLPGRVDPFDDPASAAPRLLNRRGHTAAAQIRETLTRRFMRLFQDVFLFYSSHCIDEDRENESPLGYSHG